MTYKKSSLALLIASAVALTGCLEDNYDYSGGGGNSGGGSGGASNELGTQVPLYYKYNDNQNSDWDAPYVMYAVDADGTETAVDGNALPESSNINVEGEFASADPLTVTVSDDKASLIFSADKAYDISKSNLFNADKNLGGSIQFYVNTLSYDLGDDPENPNSVLLTMFNGDKKVSTDITSSVIASSSDKAQFIRVPLNCFIDDGLDLTNVDIAMAIETEGAIQYEFSQARLANNSVSLTPASANIQGCYNNNNSKVLTDSEVILNREARVDNDGSLVWEIQGETDNIRVTRGSVFNYKPSDWGGSGEGAIRFRGIEYDSKFNPNQRSILTFAIEAGSELNDMAIPRLDMSHYMANGELQMTFLLHESTLPTGDDTYLVMTMDPPANNTADIPNGGYPSSETVSYNLNLNGVADGVVHHISIPLKEFFTKDNGSISLNTLQYIEKMTTHIEQRDSDGTADFSQLAGFKYGLADIKLVMNPEAPDTK